MSRFVFLFGNHEYPGYVSVSIVVSDTIGGFRDLSGYHSLVGEEDDAGDSR